MFPFPSQKPPLNLARAICYTPGCCLTLFAGIWEGYWKVDRNPVERTLTNIGTFCCCR